MILVKLPPAGVSRRFVRHIHQLSVIEGERGSGDICLNGAAARLVHPGDKVIVISYADFEPAELENFDPTIVHVDERNRVIELSSAPAEAAV